MRILIVEDEEKLARLIEAGLSKEGFETEVVLTGEEGLHEALRDIYDLIVLDVMLPDLDGFSILKRIRNEGLSTKVIMLTARSALDDKLQGLSQGADDYMIKPFHLEELAARIRVQLKSTPELALKAGDLEIPLQSNVLRCTTTGEAVELSARELTLMEYLMRHPGQILGRDQIYDRVWGLESEVSSNNLEAYLSFLRRKLKAVSSKMVIRAVRGLGYRLEGPDA